LAVSLRLYSVDPYRLLVEKTIKENGSTSIQDQLNNAKKIAEEIIPHIRRPM
jgi:hypothetical protein